jgi:site-specific DNA-methyltransferase (adenine-specific)
MTRVTIGSCELIHGDCLDLIEGLGQFSHVIMDPPYESHMHVAKANASGIRLDGYASPKPVDFASIDGIRERVTEPLVKACQGWLIAFCTPEGIAAWRDAIEDAGARYKRACFWEKVDSAPQFNGQGPAMAVEPFVTAWCGAGHSRWNGGGRRNVFKHPTNGRDRHGEHATEKSLSLMKEITELFTNPGDNILDPFMGSGTTGVACAKMGRAFVGIEKDRRYFDISCERIEAAYRQADLFVEYQDPRQTELAGL